ncbi:MAG: (deoxy)nucleoside triphosphate pyrophosphohydrolase [Planctomycetota bacterium]|nr:(deoxy)nucleoside triphosphate pyrophosphohydrolase [Planctomycetota bacterium]
MSTLAIPIDVGIGIVLRETPPTDPFPRSQTSRTIELLITRRPGTTVFGGYWELPGGKAESGETPDDCVRRELSEEVGVSVDLLGSLPEVVYTYPHGTVRLHPRLCRLTPGSPPPANLHVADHRWCPIDRLEDFAFPPANESIIAALRQRLAAGLDL